MKILYTSLSPEELEIVRSIAPGVEFIRVDGDAELHREIADADALFGPSVTAELIQRAKRLRWLHSTAVGVENRLFPEFLDSDIILTNGRGTTGINIAEHVFALMLAFARTLHITRLRQVAKKWEVRANLPVIEIAGDTIGIVGLGGIGLQVARRAHAFDMRVLAVDPTPRERPDHVQGPWSMDRLHDLLEESDFVAICCPHTPWTERMIGEAEFKAMKETAFLINIARGKIVDQDALIEALRRKEIAGAGLDALDPEPLPTDNPLWEMENVILTPHHAGQSNKARQRVFSLFCDNLKHFVNNEPLDNVVNKNHRY